MRDKEGSKNVRNLHDVIYGWPLASPMPRAEIVPSDEERPAGRPENRIARVVAFFAIVNWFQMLSNHLIDTNVLVEHNPPSYMCIFVHYRHQVVSQVL